FDGFPALSGGDAGNHLHLLQRFESSEPRAYNGMTALYALHHWLVHLASLDDLAASAVGWQLAVIACSALASFAVLVQTEGISARRRFVLALVSLAGVLWAGFFVALPRIHYYQSDGFLAHVFSLVPLALGALGYAATNRRWLRLVVLAVTLGAYRFTYVLNAGDLCVVCSALVVAEWRGAPPRRTLRIPLLAAAIFCLVVALFAYVNVNEIIRVPGGFYPAPMPLQLVGLGSLTLLWCFVGPVCRRFGAPCPPQHLRLAQFLGVFGGMPFALVAAWMAAGRPLSYYVHKYVFCAIVLGALCAPPVVVSAASRLVRRGAGAWPAVAALVLVALGGVGVAASGASAAQYMAGFHERISGPPYEQLGPHGDRAVWRSIEATLQQEHASFGGLMTPRWPESQFTNAHFGSPRLGHEPEGKVDLRPGRCVFWYRDLPPPLERLWGEGAKQTIAQISTSRRERCESFTPRYAPSTQLSLCRRCFQGSERGLPLAQVSKGFQRPKRNKQGVEMRWTTGNGRVPLSLTEAEAAFDCLVRVDTQGGRPYELWLDGQLLGAGPARALPRLEPGSQHELSIRSPTFTVKKSKNPRGVRVKAITVECRDELLLRATRRLSVATASSGFHGLERTSDGREYRWTNGHGRLSFETTAAEAGLPCEVRVEPESHQPYELWLDGKLLGAGPRQRLPASERKAMHELEIRSATSVPADTAGTDDRALGVTVESVTLDCGDDIAPRPVP
ncbi:MAG TPA: hypothetical protein VJU61_19985, partial [Polyangiaceae bacterium]|nr:hypothetical protein [Polyangiaceae bacterium]